MVPAPARPREIRRLRVLWPLRRPRLQFLPRRSPPHRLDEIVRSFQALSVVKAERRFVVHLMVHADELRTVWLAEESEDGVKAHLLEEIRLLDSLQQCDLPLASEARDGCGSRK